MIFLPEIRLKRICDSLFAYLRNDLEYNIQNNTEEESHLYILFHGQQNEDFLNITSKFYNEAKKIFLRKPNDSRYLQIFPCFNRERVNIPTIHIVISQDNEEFRQIGDIQGDLYIADDFLLDILERGFRAQFNLITTSDNITEVLLINYVLRALLIGAIPQLQFLGFINPQFNTQDLNINPELFPANTYIKGVCMNSIYTESVPQVGKEKRINILVFNFNDIVY